MNMRFVAALVLALAGCASQQPPQRVILLPSQDGRPSGVVVRTGAAEVVLETPYAAVEIRGTAMVPGASTAQEVERRYGRLLTAQPRAPGPFTMFFLLGTDELTPASKAAFEEVRREVTSWAVTQVVVIGHTDRLGQENFNDALARKRAESVAARLVSAGVARERIEVAARGEREPLIHTAAGVAEPRNRRVEIKVR